jgi:hypothetical protein
MNAGYWALKEGFNEFTGGGSLDYEGAEHIWHHLRAAGYTIVKMDDAKVSHDPNKPLRERITKLERMEQRIAELERSIEGLAGETQADQVLFAEQIDALVRHREGDRKRIACLECWVANRQQGRQG